MLEYLQKQAEKLTKTFYCVSLYFCYCSTYYPHDYHKPPRQKPFLDTDIT